MSQLTSLDPVLVNPIRRSDRSVRRRATISDPLVRPAVLRAAAFVLGASVLISFGGQIASVAFQPIQVTHRTGMEVRALQAEVEEQRRKNEQLERDIAYYRTRAGIEQEARRKGWVREGEVAVNLVLPPAPQRTQTASAAPVESRDAQSVSTRLRSWLETCLAVLSPMRSR